VGIRGYKRRSGRGTQLQAVDPRVAQGRGSRSGAKGEEELEDDSSAGEGAKGEQGDGAAAEVQRLKELEKEIYEMAGREFKITSYLELSRVLFEDLKIPVVKQPSNKILGGVSAAGAAARALAGWVACARG
jgi:hypothetical protein